MNVYQLYQNLLKNKGMVLALKAINEIVFWGLIIKPKVTIIMYWFTNHMSLNH